MYGYGMGWYGPGTFGNGLVVLLVLVVVFLLCREIVCWYWKLNRIVGHQERQTETLQAILKELKDLNASRSACAKADPGAESTAGQ
jgi:hypothetical protein